MIFHVFLHECQDDIGALHNASAEYDNLGIVSVNHRDCVSRPYMQTMLLNYTRDPISVLGCGKERLKIKLRDARQAGFLKSRRFPRYVRQ